MNIKKESIDILFKNSSQFSHWVDHLSLNLRTKIPKLSSILSLLDTDNSNFKIEIIQWYTVNYTKSLSRNGAYINISISIRDVPYTIFQYLEYPEKKKKIFNSEWCLTFYSTYFRLHERNDLNLSFEKAFFGESYDIINASPISRMDYRLDFFFEGGYPFPDKDFIVKMRKDTAYTLYETHQLKERKKLSKNATYSKKWVITWRTLWSKSNKSVFLRMYDKLLDCKEKWKVALYDDYFTYQNVYRLEGEFRTKFNKNTLNAFSGVPRNFTYSEFHDLEIKCMSYFWLVDLWLNKFIYQYKENKNRDNIDYRYFKDFWGRACKLALQWFNPFVVVLTQFKYRKEICSQISQQLLENLLLEFDQHKQKLISQKQIFNSVSNQNGANSEQD